MGTLTVPASGLVYLDANPIIYTVEKHPVYGPLLQPLWQAAKTQTIEVVSSQLALMETLVGPYKCGDTPLRSHTNKRFSAPKCVFFPSHKRFFGKPPACV